MRIDYRKILQHQIDTQKQPVSKDEIDRTLKETLENIRTGRWEPVEVKIVSGEAE